MDSIYNPSMWDQMTPANVRGGHSRAIKAKRDKLGRFMPNDVVGQELWTLDPQHGKAGGLALLAKKGKDYYKEIARNKKK